VICTACAYNHHVTGDSWFETRSQIYSASRHVNFRMDELLTNLLGPRAKRTLDSIKYIGTCYRSLVPTLGDCGPQDR